MPNYIVCFVDDEAQKCLSFSQSRDLVFWLMKHPNIFLKFVSLYEEAGKEEFE